MLFEDNNYDYDILSLAGFNFSNQKSYYEYDNKLVDASLGFLRGNMWENEYEPYKNMQPMKLRPTCEREELLYKIMEMDFAINDLNLYLDLHPENQNIYEMFKMYSEKCIEIKYMYAKKYGPLTLDQNYSNSYEWMKNPWPWDKNGGSMYV